MWKKLSDIFTSTSGSLQERDRAADAKLRQLWTSLVRLGLARGLRLPDAEDLAQESIIAGMESYQPARGNFEAFCHTIMANKVKNLHRDRKPQEPIPEDGGTFRDPGSGPGWASYYRQCQERTDRILADTVSMLPEAEAHFFFTLAEVHAELTHGEVSEASRRLGVTPQQGWDIFRKIQRKFKDLDRSILLPERPPEHVDDSETRFSLGDPVQGPASGTWPPSLNYPPSDIPRSERTYLGELQSRSCRFSTDLGPRERRRLRELLEP